ncbi:MAG: energy-coupling factor ABC transporter ATP-binding protein [Acidimicrobiales bacterium]
MTAAAVEITDVAYRYPGRAEPVLDGLSLGVAAGERVAVLGPNGSGKTTLMLHLNGLLSPQAGRVVIGGTPVEAGSMTEVRQRVGLVFQDPNDQLFMSRVADDVGFGPANLGWSAERRDRAVAAALAAVGATDLADRTPHHLSGGEKRRAAIATVLSMDPEVLVLDEPTAGLDPLGHHELAELLVGLGQTQVIVTHDLPFALATCPRSVVLDRGRIVVDRPTSDLLADAGQLAAHRLALPFGYRGFPPA